MGLARQRGGIPIIGGNTSVGRINSSPMRAHGDGRANVMSGAPDAKNVKTVAGAAQNALELVGQQWEQYTQKRDRIKNDIAINQAELDFDNELTAAQEAEIGRTGLDAQGAPERVYARLNAAREKALANIELAENPEAEAYKLRLDQRLSGSIGRARVEMAKHEYSEMKSYFGKQIETFAKGVSDELQKNTALNIVTATGEDGEKIFYSDAPSFNRLVENLDRSVANGYITKATRDVMLQEVFDKGNNVQANKYFLDSMDMMRSRSPYQLEEIKKGFDKWEGKVDADTLAKYKKQIDAQEVSNKDREKREAQYEEQRSYLDGQRRIQNELGKAADEVKNFDRLYQRGAFMPDKTPTERTQFLGDYAKKLQETSRQLDSLIKKRGIVDNGAKQRTIDALLQQVAGMYAVSSIPAGEVNGIPVAAGSRAMWNELSAKDKDRYNKMAFEQLGCPELYEYRW